MKNIIKKITKIPRGFKSAAVYTLATVFSRGLAIITVPIFTRIMSTEQIGIVNLYNSWYSMISVVATLSLTSGGFAVAMKEYETERDAYISSVLSLTSIISILIACFYFLFPEFCQNITGLSNELLLLMLVGFLVAPARDFWLARQRYEYKYKLAAFITILSAVMASALSLFVVIKATSLKLNQVAEYRLFANYFIIYGIALIIWITLMVKGKSYIRVDYWKYSLALSLPLVGYAISSQILNVSDRMMISKMVGNSAVGIYSTLYTVSSLSLMVWTAINASFVPYIYQNIDNKDNKIKDISSLLLIFYALIAILLVLFAPEIVRVLAPSEYYESIYIMPPIAAGVFLTSVSNMYSNILVYLKSTKYIMYASVVAAMSNLILNFIFIRKYGYMAAAYTTLFSYILMTILLYLWAKKNYNNQLRKLDEVYDNLKIFILSVMTIVIAMLGLLVYGNMLVRYVIIGILLIISFFVGKKVLYNKTLIR